MDLVLCLTGWIHYAYHGTLTTFSRYKSFGRLVQSTVPLSIGEVSIRQFFIVFEFTNGGTDLEKFEFQSMSEAWSILQQTALGLAVAEKALEFEHCDLHAGEMFWFEGRRRIYRKHTGWGTLDPSQDISFHLGHVIQFFVLVFVATAFLHLIVTKN